MVGRLRQELEEAGHMAPAIRKQREVKAAVWLASLFYSGDPSTWDGAAPI